MAGQMMLYPFQAIDIQRMAEPQQIVTMAMRLGLVELIGLWNDHDIGIKF